jgi:hypothetical protein
MFLSPCVLPRDDILAGGVRWYHVVPIIELPVSGNEIGKNSDGDLRFVGAVG